MAVRLLAMCVLILGLGFAAPVAAETPDPRMQLLFVGVSPDKGAPGGLPPDLPFIALDVLPEIAAARQTVFAARLRSSPVSVFVSDPTEPEAQFDQFFLITEISLLAGEAGYQVGLGEDRFELIEFADRVSAVVEAFNPKYRRIGFFRVTDEADEFPLAMSDVQSALNGIGFDLVVVMIGAGNPGAACSGVPEQALHYSLVSGLADRLPFGDGDGVSTGAEVEAYLTGALNRLVGRDPVCGPKYSLLIKSGNDADQELVAHSGRSTFGEMETGLYNETFEARFLLESDDRDGVQEFLANCVYCPNEKKLTDHLRNMEEFARASTLEAEIWERIRGDTVTARLAIYLENCTLCAFRAEVEAAVAELDAKARAYDSEALAYDAAAAARDIASLRAYTDSCIACTFQAEARALVSEIEADAAYQAEKDSYRAAMESRDISMLQSFLDSCEFCEGQEDIASALVVELKRAEFALPCLQLAAVPQLGGPRQLEAIDQAKAQGICASAAQAFPDDAVIRTTQGRIAQAGGDFAAADAFYALGMEAGVPSAFGLAAYSFYAPPQGGEIDLDAAVELARKGADKGDWLSQEILTVLYSEDLVPGKTPEDAFRIAENIAIEGNALAQFFVGYYYLTGAGVDEDEALAAEWLTKSVDQGYTHAFSYLADIYETGAEAEKRPARAADLYWTAFSQGDPTATERLTTQLKSRDREVIRIIQQKLRDLELYRGSVDGVGGSSTVTAIRKFSESLAEQG